MGEVHPILDMVLGKVVPIVVVGHGNAPTFFSDQLRRLDSCDGWQWITVTTYDKTTWHADDTDGGRIYNFWVPSQARY